MNRFPQWSVSRAGQQGLTLIELLVSMLISVFVVTMAIRVFIGSTHTDQLNYQFGMMQESGRIGLYSLARDVRMAGYTGCGSDVASANVIQPANASDEWIASDIKIQGVGVTGAVSQIDPDAVSEGIIVYKLSPDISFAVTRHNTGANTLTLNPSPGALLSSDNPAGILRQDCQQTALVSLSSISGSNVSIGSGGKGRFSNCATQLKGSFRCYDSSTSSGAVDFFPGYLRPLDSVAYFLKEDNGIRTLFKKSVSTAEAVPVVSGIEDMSIYYGLDNNDNGVADRFIRASDRSFRHPDWQKVTVVRVHMLVQSSVELAPSPRSYFFDGERQTPEDRFLRREYVMSISIRN